MDTKDDTAKKLSDLQPGDQVYCGLNIYTVKRVTPTGRIVTTAKNSMGMVYEETWRPSGILMGDDMWNSRVIRPLASDDKNRIINQNRRLRRIRTLDDEQWSDYTLDQLDAIMELLESFEKQEASA